MKKRIVAILGAADPEMATIESILRDNNIDVVYATAGESRVHPGNAYKAEWFSPVVSGKVDEIWLIECDGRPLRDFARDEKASVVVIDHHRPGDPGYGKPPAEFWIASSIGQTVQAIGRTFGSVPGYEGDDGAGPWWPMDQQPLMVAAADHCLGAAYRGECPGVLPDALMVWRAESRAAFQGRSVRDVLADVEAARKALRDALEFAKSIWFTDESGQSHNVSEWQTYVADLRGAVVPELPEASAREGIGFVAEVLEKGGRKKVTCMNAPKAFLQDFIDGKIMPWLVDRYGDPERGFAGGYEPQPKGV